MSAIASILRDAQAPGLGGAVQSFDSGGKLAAARAAPQKHKWSVTGTVGASTRTDQVAFYNLIADVAKGATFDLVTPAVSVAGWSAATIARYIGDCPAPLITIHLTGANTGGAANNNLFGDGTIEFLRRMPDGNDVFQPEPLSLFRHDMTQLPTVMSVPVNSEVLDGYTYPRILTAEATPSANGYQATFVFASTYDKRADVPQARAAMVQQPAR